MDYEKAYKEALERAKEYHFDGAKQCIIDTLEYVFSELAESEDERMRRELISYFRNNSVSIKWSGLDVKKVIEWLEKQGKQKYTQRDVDDAYLKGICDAKQELEKQGEPAKLSEEEQNRFAKGVLTSCALSFIDYLDAHKYEGKMCVSNGECEDIENAFHNAMWDRLHRYYCKYIEKQGELPISDIDEQMISKIKFAVSQMPSERQDTKKECLNWLEDLRERL